ncbi:ribose-phosphate diphosphokinase [Candidatus Kaiserbacteria bacterium]|nr:ribose-phosphate diphosphokinase [Candidatus Kaiserbacteria bacterium]
MKKSQHLNESPFVALSSPGMHNIATNVLRIIREKHAVTIPHHQVTFDWFSNREVKSYVEKTVRRQHVIYFHPLQQPTPNDAVMMMLLGNDAIMRASAASISLVLPYMCFLRQDRKDKERVPISARTLANLIESNRKVEQIITADMHADQEQGFFDIPVDNLSSRPLFAEYFRNMFNGDLSNVVVVAPDYGGAVRARRFALKLGDVPVAIFEKSRPKANQSEILSQGGDPVEGRIAIIYDDMIDTGGTIRGVVAELKARGAREVYVCATHGIFSGNAEENFARSGFPVLVTNSIPRDPAYAEKHKNWLTIVPMDELLAEAVYEASLIGGSVSKLSK